jgi:hypothetical protein
MVSAIEVYNRPRSDYRDENFCILLINAWELLLKAVVSKNGGSVFYHKKRHQPYRTLSWQDAFDRAKAHFPNDFDPAPVKRNLELITTFRDNAIHFYNEKELSALVWALAQTSILNYRDLIFSVFGINLSRDVNWRIMPLGASAPIDPIQFIERTTQGHGKVRPAVRQYINEIVAASRELRGGESDTGRFLTVFDIKLQSVKKIGDADVVVGVATPAVQGGPLVVERTLDPNVSHPLRQKEVLQRITSLHGHPFTAHTFQAIVWKYGLKDIRQYCWKATEGVLTKYSNDVVPFIQRLTEADVTAALTDYNARGSKSRSSPAPAAAASVPA